MTRSQADAQMREAAREIFTSCIGATPRRIWAQGGGQTNSVFRIDAADGCFVLRMSRDERKLDDFRKERYAIECARTSHVPIPKVLHVARTPDGITFMLARRAPGRAATRHVDTSVVLRQLGRYARALHETKLPAFGGQFGGDKSLGRSWDEFLDQEFQLAQRVEQLRELGLLEESRAQRAADLVRRLGVEREPSLNHGDLRLKNVLIDGSGRISAVIDWETAVAAPAPEWDLAVALHDLSIDEKDAFIDGYGIDHEVLIPLGPALAALNVLHYAPFAHAAARAGNDEQLRHYRRRFARVYEMYSLD